MNVRRILLATVLVSVLAAQAPAQQGQPQPNLIERVSKSLARVEYKIGNEFLGVQPRAGLAICIDAKEGTFLTRDVLPNVVAGDLKELTLTPTGSVDGVKAELLGYDPGTRFAFLKALERRNWTALRFEQTANLQTGQRLVSVGLLGPNTASTPYMGSALVAAQLRMPHHLVLVAGGELSSRSSPVMTMDGRVIGVVGGELPMEQRMQLGNQVLDVLTAGRQWTRFFIPVTEFAHLFKDAVTPSKPRRLPWTGILFFQPVSAEEEALDKALKGRPAVVVDRVVPNSPATRAGVEQTDTIVGMNGKPLEKLATPALTRDNFLRVLRRVKPGQAITLTVRRKGKESERKIVTESMPLQRFEAPRYYNFRLGLGARDLVMFDRYGGASKPILGKGVLVFRVIPQSPAALGDLANEDVIITVNDKPTPDVATLKAVLDPLANVGLTPISFEIRRGDSLRSITVTPPPQSR